MAVLFEKYYKITFSHSPAVWGRGCLYLPVSAYCSEACGGGGAKAIRQVPGRAGSGDTAPASLVLSSEEELTLLWSFVGWEEQSSISRTACFRA